MVNIRRATMEDAALIADMSRETFYDSFAKQNTKADMDIFLAEQFSRDMLLKQVAEPSNIFFIAYENEQPAGYLFVKEGSHSQADFTNPLEISRLYACKQFIGKGIGKKLMQTAIDYATASGNDAVWLGVWEHNLRAIQFYTSFGFEKFGEHDFLLGNDLQRDWLMRIVLI